MRAFHHLILVILFLAISQHISFAQCTNYPGTLDPNTTFICADDIYNAEAIDQVVDANSIIYYRLYEQQSLAGTPIDVNTDGNFLNSVFPRNTMLYVNIAILDYVNGCDTISDFKPIVFLEPVEVNITSIDCDYPNCTVLLDLTISGGHPEYNGIGFYTLSGDAVDTGISYGDIINLGPFPDQSSLGYVAGDQNNCQGSINTTLSALCNEDSIFINEIHYENVGADVDEGIEIVGQAGFDVSNYTLYFIDGTSGSAYDSLVLSGLIPDQDAGYGTLWFPVNDLIDTLGGILIYNECRNEVRQFLSYEGTFTSMHYLSNGYISEDIGINENNAQAGESLQLIGVGQSYSSFTWSGPIAATAGQTNKTETLSKGQMNTYQFFGSDPGAIIYSNQEDIIVDEQAGSILLELSVTNLSQMEIAELNLLSLSSSTDNNDYTINENSISFTDLSSSSQTRWIEILIIDDDEVEQDETLVLELSSSALTIPKQIELTIIDNDVVGLEESSWAQNISYYQIEDKLFFTSDEIIDNIMLLNLNGQVLGSSNSSEFIITNLQSGIYFAIIKMNDFDYLKKVGIRNLKF